MSDDTRDTFDPRFDPAFQRGFDASATIVESIPEPVIRTPVEDAAPPVVRRAETAAGPVPKAPPTAQRIDAAQKVDDSPLVVLADEDDAASEPLGRNPFVVALIVVAIVLVVAGVWLFVQAQSSFDDPSRVSQGGYMSMTAVLQVAPFVSLLGVATVIGILFTFAARWRRKN
jgi:hypothetical protein